MVRKSVGIIVVLGLMIAEGVSDFAGAQELAKEQVAVFALMGGDIGAIDPMGVVWAKTTECATTYAEYWSDIRSVMLPLVNFSRTLPPNGRSHPIS